MSIGTQLRNEFTRYLDQKGYKYSTVDEEDNIVRLIFTGASVEKNIFVDFDEELDSNGVACVHFVAQDFAKCSSDNVAAVIDKLNDLNRNYRWVKFWLDKRDNTISADADAMVFSGTAGEECLNFVLRVVRVVEAGYKDMRDLVLTDGGGSDVPSDAELLEMLEQLSRLLGK